MMGLKERLTAVLLCLLIPCLVLIVREQNRIKACMETKYLKITENVEGSNAEIRIHHLQGNNNQSDSFFQVLSGSLHVKLSQDGSKVNQSTIREYSGFQAKQNVHVLDEVTSKKKVLLFAYMKGGSTFVGELFNQFPNSMYFYEPVAGFYSALYGSPDWTFPLEVLLNSNGSFRFIPQKEFDSITSYMKLLYQCDIPHLPLEYLQHQGLWLSSSTYDYRRCLLDRVKDQLKKEYRYMDHLLHNLGEQCPNNIQICKERRCDVFMDLSRIDYSAGAFQELHPCLKNETLLYEFRQRRKIFQSSVEKCMEKIHVPCVTSQLMVVKALRLTMEMVRTLLRRDSHLKLVYLVRDPRGILISRKKVQYLSQVFEPNMESEALLLCPKVTRDYDGFLTLQSEFPDRVLLLRYEDAADHPQEAVDRVYKFIGLRPSTSIKEWVEKNTQANSDGDNFDTKRANSSATAHAWRRKIPPTLKSKMDLLCANIIHRLGYNL